MSVFEAGDVAYIVVEAYIFEVWMASLGASAIGVYALLCRLADENNQVEKFSIKELAFWSGIGDKTFLKIVKRLRDFGFIQMKTPTPRERNQGINTIFRLLQPPKELSDEAINQILATPKRQVRPIKQQAERIRGVN